jgi:hypothetical protein
MSAEAVHRHNFPTLCRRKPKASWEVVAGLEWTRKRDGTDNSGRPMYDYEAHYGSVHFHITKSTDAGFGISVYDNDRGERLTSQQIEWRRTLKACQARAVEIMAALRRKADATRGEASS